jgi:DNA-directed RNA polymerase specialized sigma24 family protein
MSAGNSVTRWLNQLQDGDPDAAQRLWERYFARLVGLARQRLRQAPRQAADEEDVALSAFDSFCRAAEGGRFPRLQDRDDLWRLLVVITTRKACHLVRDQGRRRRGGAAGAPRPSDDLAVLEQALSREPSPELAAQVTEEYGRLLRRLGDAELEAVAVWRMEGYSVEEIAVQLGCAPRSVKRKLQLIRTIWQHEVQP